MPKRKKAPELTFQQVAYGVARQLIVREEWLEVSCKIRRDKNWNNILTGLDGPRESAKIVDIRVPNFV